MPQATYMSAVPPPHGAAWPELMADQAGMNWMWLEEAARFATENETPWPYDLRLHLESGHFEPAPFNEILGPIRPRGEPNGLILRGGAKVVSWGDTQQADFTFSAAKSYLSLLAGIAVMDGLIPDIDDRVALTVDDGGFEGPHNGAITWRHLLPKHVRMGRHAVWQGGPDRPQPDSRALEWARARRAMSGSAPARRILGI